MHNNISDIKFEKRQGFYKKLPLKTKILSAMIHFTPKFDVMHLPMWNSQFFEFVHNCGK